MPKFLLLFFFLIQSHPGFCQGDLEKQPLTPNGGKVIIKNTETTEVSASQTQASPESTPVETQSAESSITEEGRPLTPEEEDQRDLEELKRVQEKQRSQFKQIDKSVDPLREPLNPISEMQKLTKGQLSAITLLDEKFIKLLKETFKDGLLSGVPRDEVKAMLKLKTKGNLIGDLFDHFPVCLEIAVDLLRDKNAFLSLLDLLLRKEDLKDYAYIAILIFLIGLYIKHRLVKPKWPFFRRFRWKLAISLCLNVITIFVFYLMFSVELDPVLKIINSHL